MGAAACNPFSIPPDAGGEAKFIRCDVSKEAEVIQMVNFVKDNFSRLDYAFNNAGKTECFGGCSPRKKELLCSV
jgi:NAD(P)-dependent dehydrogenase (short-subunit alcohol dehydrogenase family)